MRALAWEFVASLKQRYPESIAQIDAYMAAQNFEAQLGDLLIHFTPPDGECLLARSAETPAGILMLKRFDAETCEINRMVVQPEFRGRGIGQALYAKMGFAEEDWCAPVENQVSLSIRR